MKNFRLPSPFYEREPWVNYQVRIRVSIDLKKRPHVLVVGNTGTGKTHLIKVMIAHFLKSYLDSELYVCDFKGDDFSYFLENEDRYFCYEDYAKGIELFYERFKARLEKSDLTTNRCILLIDEWNNFIISLDKKEQEKYKKMISTILNMSRSKNMSVICGVQRADVAYLSSSRDSYTNVVGLGALSKESIAMIFNDYKDSVTPLPRGQGYFLEDGNDIKQIIVPQVHMDKVDQMILKGIRNRNK